MINKKDKICIYLYKFSLLFIYVIILADLNYP